MAGNVPSLPSSIFGTGASSQPSSNAASGSSQNQPAAKPKSQTNDFMQLLVAQMTHQSPLNPTSGDQFMMQLAQLQMVSELHELSTKMSDWASSQTLSGSASLIGRNVTIQSGSTTVGGVVESVSSQAGKLMVIVGGQPYDMANVLSVK